MGRKEERKVVWNALASSISEQERIDNLVLKFSWFAWNLLGVLWAVYWRLISIASYTKYA